MEWRGGAWNHRLSEIFMRAVEESDTTFDADEDWVLKELYERITIRRTTEAVATRTKEEVAALLAFWWEATNISKRFAGRKPPSGHCGRDTERGRSPSCEKTMGGPGNVLGLERETAADRTFAQHLQCSFE